MQHQLNGREKSLSDNKNCSDKMYYFAVFPHQLPELGINVKFRKF